VPCVALILVSVSVATLFVHPLVAARWGLGAPGVIEPRRLAALAPVPLLGLAGLVMAFLGARTREAHPHTPLIGGMMVFLSGYLGLAVGFVPGYH
jgi:cytochrome d ubiquinol oxidase subunit II